MPSSCFPLHSVLLGAKLSDWNLRCISAIGLTLLLCAVGRSADSAAFLCPGFDGDYSHEAKLVRIAPHGAKRVGKRQLQVFWAGGRRVFSDMPPYDEPLAGVR